MKRTTTFLRPDGRPFVRRSYDFSDPTDLRDAVRYVAHEKFAWPGGYTLFTVQDDGDILCFRCVREHFRLILESTRDDLRDGWQVIGCESTCNMEDPASESCAHCRVPADKI